MADKGAKQLFDLQPDAKSPGDGAIRQRQADGCNTKVGLDPETPRPQRPRSIRTEWEGPDRGRRRLRAPDGLDAPKKSTNHGSIRPATRRRRSDGDCGLPAQVMSTLWGMRPWRLAFRQGSGPTVDRSGPSRAHLAKKSWQPGIATVAPSRSPTPSASPPDALWSTRQSKVDEKEAWKVLPQIFAAPRTTSADAQLCRPIYRRTAPTGIGRGAGQGTRALLLGRRPNGEGVRARRLGRGLFDSSRRARARRYTGRPRGRPVFRCPPSTQDNADVEPSSEPQGHALRQRRAALWRR